MGFSVYGSGTETYGNAGYNYGNSASTDVTVSPPVAGTTTYTGLAPTITLDWTATAPLASTTTYLGYVATVGNAFLAPLGTLTYTGLAPVIAIDKSVAAPLAATTTYAGLVALVNAITPPAGAYSLTGLAPTITGTANVTVPLAGTTTYKGFTLPNYAATVLEDTPWLYWKFNDAAGSGTVTDYSGNFRNGTVTGSGSTQVAPTGVSSDPGWSLTSGTYVSSPTTAPAVDPLSSTNWTFEFWNKGATLLDFSQFNSHGVGTGGLEISVETVDFKVTAIVDKGGPNEIDVTYLPPSTGPNDWVQIVGRVSVVRTGTDGGTGNGIYLGTFDLFYDGRPVATGTKTVTSATPFTLPMAANTNFGIAKMINDYPFVAISLSIDDLSVYNYSLSDARIFQHYALSGTNVDATIAVPKGNLVYTGLAPTVTNFVNVTAIPVASQTTTYLGFAPAVSTSAGSVTLLVPNTNYTYAGLLPTISAAIQNINVSVLTGTYSLTAPAPLVFPDFVEHFFGFVNPEYVGFTALDANYVVNIDMGTFFHSEEKSTRFRLANLSPNIANFAIVATGSNADLVTFSLDNQNWSSSVNVKIVKPNAVTDIIYCRLQLGPVATIGAGNFLIDVDQTYA